MLYIGIVWSECVNDSLICDKYCTFPLTFVWLRSALNNTICYHGILCFVGEYKNIRWTTGRKAVVGIPK